MGCSGSKGGVKKQKRIEMKMTKLEELDEIFTDAQGIIDEVYAIKVPIEKGRKKFMSSADMDKISCAFTNHATLGTIFAFFASSKSVKDAIAAVKITPDAPFISLDSKSATGKLADTISDFTNYVQALLEASVRIAPLAAKAAEFAEKAPELPEKAKSGVQGSTGLGLLGG